MINEKDFFNEIKIRMINYGISDIIICDVINIIHNVVRLKKQEFHSNMLVRVQHFEEKYNEFIKSSLKKSIINKLEKHLNFKFEKKISKGPFVHDAHMFDFNVSLVGTMIDLNNQQEKNHE